MATFVIVHGGWGGGWEWAGVARKLRGRGHEVFTPTLTGLGEREHLGKGADLSDHVEDVLAVLAFEELQDVVLCGHSYGGMVVTGVADRAPGRVQLLVYLDGFVPGDGEALVDLLPEDFGNSLVEAANAHDGGTSVPIPPELLPPEGSLPEEVRERVIARVRPHPLATMTEPIRLSGAVERLPRAFVCCTGEIDAGNDLMESFAVRARSEEWLYRELPARHDLQLTDPEATTAVLDDLARLGD